ncbi:MAG: DUF370 domain-containing protein [Acutalibacteraceae bacterium]|nr:DUF370 domain-containing protein [Acutalibacteraceae bacterium]
MSKAQRRYFDLKLVNIGFGNLVNASRIISVISPDSAPAKRIIAEAKADFRLIDATQGRRTRAVIITDSDHVVLSYLQTETIAAKLSGNNDFGGIMDE